MKRISIFLSVLCLTAALTVPASAAGPLTYDIAAPGNPEYGKDTSIEIVHTADNGAAKNEDVSKNAALIPPAFGSPSADTLHTGTYLTPNLAPGGMPMGGAAINGSGAGVVFPGSPVTAVPSAPDSTISISTTTGSHSTTGYTDVTSDLYYSGNYLGWLKIPSIDVNVKVYQGTGSSVLAKGAGHFEDTSIWDGNCCIAAHNRGVNAHFGDIHKLDVGDKITWTTKLGTRTYAVTSVNKISETDCALLTPTAENCVTLFTCVQNQSAYRWAVRAIEIV